MLLIAGVHRAGLVQSVQSADFLEQKMPDARCLVNKAVVEFLQTELQMAFGNPKVTEANLKRLLQRAEAPQAEVESLPHTVAQWARPAPNNPEKYPTPDSDILVRLAKALDKSLDPMVGHIVRRPPPAKIQGELVKQWLREFLPQCANLSCYTVFLPKSDVDNWVAKARDAASDEKAQIALAQEWAKKIEVFAVSDRLRREHKLANVGANSRPTMDKLLRQRLRWIAAVSPHGKDLEKIACREAYVGIYNTITEQHAHGEHERYPSKQGKRVLSLRVRFDSLPMGDHEVGWMVYYNFGPPLSEERILDLLKL